MGLTVCSIWFIDKYYQVNLVSILEPDNCGHCGKLIPVAIEGELQPRLVSCQRIFIQASLPLFITLPHSNSVLSQDQRATVLKLLIAQNKDEWSKVTRTMALRTVLRDLPYLPEKYREDFIPIFDNLVKNDPDLGPEIQKQFPGGDYATKTGIHPD